MRRGRLTAVLAAGTALLSGTGLVAGTSSVPALARPAAAQPRHLAADRTGLATALLDRTGSQAVLSVRYASPSDAGAVRAAARQWHGTVRHDRDLSRLSTLSVTVPGASVDAATAALRDIDGVLGVSRDRVRRPFGYVPDDPQWSAQSGYLSAVGAPEAWDTTHGSSSVPIAVVDTGVDVSHPDLADKVTGAYDAVDGTATVTDADGHGTMVAGIAASATDNGVGIAGAGFDSSLLAVKVAGDSGGMDSSDVAAGIVWATDHGARVVDLSFGGPVYDSTEASAVDYAVSHGVVVVAAAGNDAGTTVQYPAAYPGVIAVGATDGAGNRAAFSNYGDWVTVGAPGVAVYGTVPSAVDASGYATGDGTSYAAALVAGEAALVIAADPAATAAQVRAAVVGSAHGYDGLGLGTGQVDFAAALTHLPPQSAATLTAPVPGPVTGDVTLTATSDAPSVRFTVDGGTRVLTGQTSGGSASATWSTWGLQNGVGHTIAAAPCNAYGCGPSSDPVQVTIDNPAPVLTAPTAGQVAYGTVTMKATAPGGTIGFFVDGVRRVSDPTAPYSVTVNVSGWADGTHSAYARACSPNGLRCVGPQSATVSFVTKSLHLRITAVSPSPFSPNGDGRRDTTTVGYHLPESATVGYVVRNSGGSVVAIHTFGAMAAGDHSFVWKGRNSAGIRVADGVLSVTLNASKTIQGVVVKGSARHSVRVDDTRPGLTSVSGGGATFYPYRDGYRDTFTPRVHVSEPATLTLEVRNGAGSLVRRLSAKHSSAGRYGSTWNGRYAGGSMVPAGTYRFSFVATDVAGNRRTVGGYSVVVSTKRLVAKTATVTKSGLGAYGYESTDNSCAGDDPGASDFSAGVWMVNVCDPVYDGDQLVAGFWHVGLPQAVRYGSLRVAARGFTTSEPIALLAAFHRYATGDADIPKVVEISSEDDRWWGLGSVSAAGHVNSSRVVDLALALPNWDGLDDFDVAAIRLTATYYVLR